MLCPLDNPFRLMDIGVNEHVR